MPKIYVGLVTLLEKLYIGIILEARGFLAHERGEVRLFARLSLVREREELWLPG